MIGVTIGVGSSDWTELAEISARRMARFTRLKCFVLGEDEVDQALGKRKGYEDIAWAKLKVFELFPQESMILWFDADVIALRPWDPLAMVHESGWGSFHAVEEDSPTVQSEKETIGLPKVRPYVNMGLWMTGAEHAPVLQAAFKCYPKWHRWQEQSAANWALYQHDVQIEVLPASYNDLRQPGTDRASILNLASCQAVNVHLYSCGSDARRRLGLVRQMGWDV